MKKLQKCLEEQTKENFVSKEERYYSIFFTVLSEVFFVFLNFYRKITGMVVKTATCVPFEDSEVQQFFEKLHSVSTFVRVWDKKTRAFSRKIFFRVLLTGYRAFRGISCGKQIYLSKKFFSFWYQFSRLSNFFVVLQFFQSVVSKQRFTFVEKRNCEN